MSELNLQVLQNPSFWDCDPDSFEVRETHLSWVFLVGDQAYKLKKPVSLYFVDFRTLENRKHFCHEEVRLNSRWASNYYLGVVSLHGTHEEPSLTGEGPAIDYLVHMRRWDESQQLDHLELSTDDAAPLAIRLSQLQGQSAIATSEQAYGNPTDLAEPALLNFHQVRPALTERSDLEQLDQLQGWADEALKRLWPRMSERKDKGRIREVHGDLYAGHIVRDEFGYQPVDCVEYRSEFRWVDVISEMANLVMDLEARSQQALANRLINAWLETTGDYHGLWVYTPYKAYRAMVRAKSALLELEPAKVEREKSLTPIDLYREYANRAESYTQVPHRFLVITHGTIGCGKGDLSNRLVEELGCIRLRTDVERRRSNGMAIDAPTDAELDAGIHGPEASDRVYQDLAVKAEQVLRAGFPVMISGSFLKRRQRERFERLADAQGVYLVLLKCCPDDEWIEQQIRERAVIDANPTGANMNLLNHQRREIEALTPHEETFTRQIDTSDAEQIGRLIQELKGVFQPNYV